MAIIIKTIKGAMLQDTIAGKIYTPRRPHLTEMNSFVESFVNAQSNGIQGGAARKRPAQLLVLVSSDQIGELNEGVSDIDLHEAWKQFLDEKRDEATKKANGNVAASNRAVENLSDEVWAEFALSWARENSSKPSKKAEAPKPADNAGNPNRTPRS